MNRFKEMWTGVLVACSLASVPLCAQDTTHFPASLANASGALCLKVSKQGIVNGAYILSSTGNTATDREMINWAQQLQWPEAPLGDLERDVWFPMRVAFGKTPPPKNMKSCPTAK